MFEKIGVIGAGVMGTGVAVDLTLHGICVVLVDIDPGALETAEAEIRQAVRLAPLLNKKLPKTPVQEALDRIRFTTQLSQVAHCDFIVENVPENRQIKESVFRELDELCPPHVCFGVNTSCLSITQLAAVTQRADKMVGIHFMNPVYLKPVVEVMRGVHTCAETLERVNGLLARMDKKAIVVQDLPGFVSNRVSHLFMNEAMWVVQDQVADPAQVDRIFKECFGHKMGPLETADLIGLDVVRDSLGVLYESYQDPKFRCCPLLQRMVDAGHLGRKSGQGFFPYDKP